MTCEGDKHKWERGYYGWVCAECGLLDPDVWVEEDEEPEHGTCEICLGEWGDGWSNCTCDEWEPPTNAELFDLLEGP